jgi:hypothetical protein
MRTICCLFTFSLRETKFETFAFKVSAKQLRFDFFFNCLDYNFVVSSVVVAQSYEVEADNEYVIRGNSAVMKCEVPSFVSDFVVVENWQDSKGNSYLPGDDYGKRPDIFRKTPSFRSMHAYSTLQNTTVVSLQS